MINKRMRLLRMAARVHLILGTNRLRPCPSGQGPPAPVLMTGAQNLLCSSSRVEVLSTPRPYTIATCACCQAATTRDDALDQVQPLRNELTMSTKKTLRTRNLMQLRCCVSADKSKGARRGTTTTRRAYGGLPRRNASRISDPPE